MKRAPSGQKVTGHLTTNDQDSGITMPAMGAEADWAWVRDELAFAWRSAQDEALSTYRAWSESPSRTAYVVYRAAQDRADQAQDALAAESWAGRGPRSRWQLNQED